MVSVSIRVYRSLLIFLTKHFLLCWHYALMLLGTYYAQNYAGIIDRSLAIDTAKFVLLLNLANCYKVHKLKAEDIATEKSVALKGHKYVIDTTGVTKSHRLVIDTVGVTKSHRLVIDTAGVTKSHTLVIDTAHAGKAQVC